MTTQYDVKSIHAATSGLMVGYRTRLKGAVVFPFTGATGYSAFVDNTSITGTYARTTTTATITSANHGLSTGQWVYLDWDLADNPYQVTVTGTNTFTVTVANSGDTSGAATVYNGVLAQATVSTVSGTNLVIPGEGILAQNGVRVVLDSSVTATIYYG